MSAFNTPWFNSQDNSFFNHLNQTKIPHLVLTAETEDFDEEAQQQWQDEGFNCAYEPLLNGGQEWVKRVHSRGDSFGVGEYYGIVAYGDAASLALEAHLKPNNPRLCAIVAYYPSAIPSVNTKFPPSVKVVVHLAGKEVGVTSTKEVLGIQGKRSTVRKRLDPGEGYGGSLRLGYKAYTYEGCEPGFAEHDLDEYDPVSESVAFTRSLDLLRKGFKIDAGVHAELTRDAIVSATVGGNKDKLAKYLRPYGHVLHAPTLTGGIGSTAIANFYAQHFHPLPASFSSKLLSRTIGTDRVVDELYIYFTHSIAVPWLLPGVPATHRKVEIVMVSIMCVRGGMLESEHLYWDQASVLVQVGLLDAKAVPQGLREKGVRTLPVVGAEGARAMKRGSSKVVNGLIGGGGGGGAGGGGEKSGAKSAEKSGK